MNFLSYIPNTDKEREQMLAAIGVDAVDELFKVIPAKARLARELNIPKALAEMEVQQAMAELANQNQKVKSFLGAGAYQHFSPAVVDMVISRSEFLTAYTPYQAERSQGMLQAIYEYQTMVCQLTGMDVTNASMYDGATSMAEAVIMCHNIKGRKKVLVSKAIHPDYRSAASTYAKSIGIELVEIEMAHGLTSLTDLQAKLDVDVAGVFVQSPNFFGCVEPMEQLAPMVKAKQALFCAVVTEATSLGLLQPPGAYDADIVVGEGQGFGIPVSYGGPYLGIIATKDEYVRAIPGRLVGKTVDSNGDIGYMLTLQAREQHIRRHRATSNICTNEGLMMLAACVWLAMVGKELKALAELNYHKAHYLQQRLEEIGLPLLFRQPFYNEFAVQAKDSKAVLASAAKDGIVAGLRLQDRYPELGDAILICVTETASRADLDQAVEVLRRAK